MDIYKKFAAAWERVENPPLDSVNPHFKSKFASLGAVYKAIRKACEGIAYMQAFGTEDSGGDTILTINSWLQDAEGGRIDLSSMRMPVTDNPQQQGSIITYYRRYVAVTDWGILGEEDDDAERAMGKDDLQAAKQRLAKACEAFAKRYGKTKKEIADGVTKRPDYKANKDNAEWYDRVARELLDG